MQLLPTSGHVTRDYTLSNPAPLSGIVGETIHVTDEIDLWEGNPAWRWVKCHDAHGNSGWVATNYLTMHDADGVLARDYSAQELTVYQGQSLTILVEESGWCWCRTAIGDEGWVPLSHIATTSPS